MIIAATYRTETRFLRVAMVCVLCLEVAERAVVGYARLRDSAGGSVLDTLPFVGPVRMALAVSMFVLAAAIFALDRTEAEKNGEETGGQEKAGQ